MSAAQALAAIREHPRHLVLAALVAGLLIGRAGPGAIVAAALLGGLLAARGPAVALAGAGVLAGAALSEARLAALDAGVLARMHGSTIQAHAVLLEPVRDRRTGPSVARVRLLDGPGAGEQAVVRARVWPSTTPWRSGAARDGVVGRTTAAAPGGGRAGGGGAAGGEIRVGHAGQTGGDAAVGVGDIVAVTGRVAPLGRSDAYQRKRNAHATIVATQVEETGRRRGGAAGALDAMRRRAQAGLTGGLAPPEAALLRGMVLGEDERLTEAVREDFKRSGLAHILAVSGQNVMLLAALVLGACALTPIPLRARLVLAAAVIAVYVPLAGGGPSIQRAGLMGVAGLVAALAGRPARRWYALLLAAAGTLALNPRAAEEPGWQLSFAAVAALLVGASPLRAALGRRMPGPVADAAAITIAATLGTAPLMALHFQQISLAALPANLLAAPAIAPVMWLGTLASAAAQVAAPLAIPFAVLAAPLLVYVQGVARVTAYLPFATVEVGVPAPVLLIATVVLAAAVTLVLRSWIAGPRVRGARRLAPARASARVALAVALAAALVVAVAVRARGAPPPAPGELVITFLDVGQGDATLLQLDGVTVLVDTGKPDGPIVTRLREAGVERLDALMLTHAEADHEGAAEAVIAAFEPRLVVDGGAGWPTAVQRALPRMAAAERARIHAPAAGQRIALGGLRFEVLWPPPRPAGWRAAGDPNDNALVMRLEAAGRSVLLTADAESPVLAPLDLEPVDVLKVSHHGSADPGLPALLTRLTPRVAAIEVGEDNTYGHPAPSTVAALAAAVPTVLRTDRDGTVRVRARGARMWVER